MIIFVAIAVVVVILLCGGGGAYMYFADGADDKTDDAKKHDDGILDSQLAIIENVSVRVVWVSNGFGYITTGKYADKKVEYDSCEFDNKNNCYVIRVKFETVTPLE